MIRKWSMLLQHWFIGHEKHCVFIVSIICSVFSRFIIPLSSRTNYSISFGPLIYLGICLFIFSYIIKKHILWHKSQILLFVLAIFYTLCLQFGSGIVNSKILINYRSILFIAPLFINSIPIFGFLVIIEDRLKTIDKSNSSKIQSIVIFAVLLACWLPILLGLWPGIFRYDVGDVYLGSWRQFSTGQFTNHKSFLFTLILGSILKLGLSFGNFNTGVAIYTVLQAILSSAALTYIINWMYRNKLPRWLPITTLIYFAFDPIISAFVLCDCEDTPFAILLVLLSLSIYEIVQHNIMNWKDAIKVIVYGFLVCAFRPNGIYALLGLLLFIPLIIKKPLRLHLLLTITVSLICAWVWYNPISNACGVEKSKLQNLNAYSMPIQQVAYVYKQGLLNASEIQHLQNIGWIAPIGHNSEMADDARKSMEKMTGSQRIEAWWYIIQNHPWASFEGMLLQTEDAWNPYSYSDSKIPDVDFGKGETTLLEFAWDPPAKPESKIPLIFDFFAKFSNTLLFQEIPLFSLLVSLPLYTATTLFVIVYALIKKDRASLLALSTILPIILTVLLGPGVITRYYLYLFLGLPMYIGMIINSNS